jgi:hypothetical protein
MLGGNLLACTISGVGKILQNSVLILLSVRTKIKLTLQLLVWTP